MHILQGMLVCLSCVLCAACEHKAPREFYLDMEEPSPVTYICGATLRMKDMLPNEAVRLSIGRNTQELDIVTARVAVNNCNDAVNAYVTQHPLSPTKPDSGSIAEHAFQDKSSRDDVLGTLPEYLLQAECNRRHRAGTVCPSTLSRK